ncbi:hypothetical protein M0R45_004362 [Rubus argutus]|uniref:Uncharacterized protein n=1 Tax=Rubus argutus TaxID=59490 RepID=A0AAW1YJJ1_RUBAR
MDSQSNPCPSVASVEELKAAAPCLHRTPSPLQNSRRPKLKMPSPQPPQPCPLLHHFAAPLPSPMPNHSAPSPPSSRCHESSCKSINFIIDLSSQRYHLRPS